MLISKAYAQAVDISTEGVETVDAGAALMWNIGMVAVLVLMFYVLLIMPQQKRFKEHSAMLSGLEKGDKVVTGGGLVGKIDKIIEEKDEVVIDLGNGVKVTALRSTISSKNDPRVKAANDSSTKDKRAK